MSSETIIVDVSGGHGSLGRTVTRERLVLDDAKRSFTIGRSVNADVTIDDEHVAALHAAVEVAPDGRITVRDLGSANGVIVDGKRHVGSVLLPTAASRLQIGRSTVRIRTAHEPLPPEKPVQHGIGSLFSTQPGVIAGVAAAICVLQLGHAVWYGAPRDLVAAIATTLGGSALILAVWTAAWSLLSRILLGEWHWLRHAAIFLCACVVYRVASSVGDLSSSVLSYAGWADQSLWIGLVVLSGALGLHLANASNLTSRHATMVAAAVLVFVGGAASWSLGRNAQQDVNLVNSRFQIYPAALRLRSTKSLDGFLKDAGALRAATDRKRDVARAKDSGDAGGLF